MKIKYLFQTFLLLVLIGSPSLALARTATWDGGGSGNLASTAANWDTDVTPVAGDDIVFDATSTKACTWDISSATTFNSFSINAGAQAITLNSSLNLTGAYTQASGTMTFNTGSPVITAGANSTVSGGTINHSQEPNGTGTTAARQVNIVVNGDFNLSSGGTINVVGLGFGNWSGPVPPTHVSSGGGYAGDATRDTCITSTNWGGVGSISNPVTAGSGGSSDSYSNLPGSGGGAIKLNVAGTLTVDGSISAKGGDSNAGYSGGGAGGSVWIIAGTLAGSGAISANGGEGRWGGAGGGSGGRVALHYTTRTHNGAVTAYGPVNSCGPAGTVYTKAASDTYGSVVIDNNNTSQTVNSQTRISATAIKNLTLAGKAKATLTGSLALSGDLSINSNTELTQNSQAMTIGGNWTNSGTFISSALVTFDTTSPSVISGANTFSALTIAPGSGGKTVTFPAGVTQTITNAFIVSGSSGNVATLRSSSNGSYWNIAPNGSISVSYVDVKDSNNTNANAVSPTNSVDSGNNVNWFTYVVSGIAYSDQGSTPLGSGVTIAAAVNGVARGTTTTTNGNYSFAVSYSLNDSVLLYISGNAVKGTVVTVSPASTMTGMNIYGSTLIARHDSGSSITNTNFSTAKGAISNSDILYSVSGGALSLSASTKFYLWSGKTFAPGGNVTFTDTYTNQGTLQLTNSETLTSFTNDSSHGTTEYTGGSTYVSFSGGNSYYHLLISGAGTYSPSSTLTVNGNLTISNGSGVLSLNGNNLTLGVSSTVSNLGTIDLLGSETLTNFSNDTSHGIVKYSGLSSYNSLAAGDTYYNLSAYGPGSYTLASNAVVNGNLTFITRNGYANGYTYYKTITIDHTKVGATLTNYPLLYSVTDTDLKTVANGGLVQNSNGYDIVFYANDEITPLSHEIESYTASTGQIIAWIKVPSVSNTVDTVIRMYYGNASINSSQQQATATWDSNFKGVWHMKEASGTVYDSTSNAINGTYAGTYSGTTGVANGAANLNTGYISGTSVSLTGDFTISAWVNLYSGIDQNDSIIGKSGQDINFYSGLLRLYTGSDNIVSNTAATAGVWQQWVVKRSGTALTIFLNGNQLGVSGSYAGTFSPTSIGLSSPGSGIGAKMDEVRISTSARANGWLSTEYNNQNNPGTFSTTSARQTGVPGTTTFNLNSKTLTVNGDFDNTAGGSLSGTGTVIFAGANPSTVYGSTTFPALSCTTAGKTLTFTAGTTQTISGALTLTGTSGNKIILRSSSSPTRWNIDPQGTTNVSFVDIQDSNNSNASSKTASSSIDSGNNNNWTITPECTDNDGDGYGNPGAVGCTHPETDCDDTRAVVHPGAREIINGLDDDCDGVRDNNNLNHGIFSSPL